MKPLLRCMHRKNKQTKKKHKSSSFEESLDIVVLS